MFAEPGDDVVQGPRILLDHEHGRHLQRPQLQPEHFGRLTIEVPNTGGHRERERPLVELAYADFPVFATGFDTGTVAADKSFVYSFLGLVAQVVVDFSTRHIYYFVVVKNRKSGSNDLL